MNIHLLTITSPLNDIINLKISKKRLKNKEYAQFAWPVNWQDCILFILFVNTFFIESVFKIGLKLTQTALNAELNLKKLLMKNSSLYKWEFDDSY